jgi:heme/copper-type cytochrome/quinol oxidase subunit 3
MSAAARARAVNAYVGMVVFLGGWTMMFAGLFFTYGAARANAPAWPPPGDPALPLVGPSIMTALIAASSALVAIGVHGVRTARPSWITRTLPAAIGLGVVFVGLQVSVWRSVLRAGLHASTDVYGSAFYALTGMHAAHALVGLIGLALLLPRALGGRFTVEDHTPLRLWAIFWHFVGAVWIVTFVTVFAR